MDRILEALNHIPCAAIDRGDWIRVGMALEQEGYSCNTWDTWSQTDPSRYKTGECTRIWAGFHGSSSPVAGGTIINMAQAYGYSPARAYEEDGALDFEDEIEWDGDNDGGADGVKATVTPAAWDRTKEIITYMETLFEPEDYVGYITTDVEKTTDGKWIPNRAGAFDRTAEELISLLRKHPDDPGAVLGDYNEQAGAWCHINGLDGHGVRNTNVVSFRYGLVESDTVPISEQIELYQKLNLPIATLTTSGGKSVHAVVHIDAKNRDEYDKKINFLYDYLISHGFDVDKQNRNPSRTSRMPGFMRGGKKQHLIGINLGANNWNKWIEFIEGDPDGLPEVVFLADMEEPEKRPQLAPELIGGLLRQGHKMLFSAASKAGKSFTLMQLTICLAKGLPFLGFPCKKSKVFYVNLEIDGPSCVNRFFEIADAMGEKIVGNIALLNLRGNSMSLEKLAPKIIRLTKEQGYGAIIIDPIYKVLQGDENAAGEMGRFCNCFDKICSETGAAVIYAHHHSKGVQGGKAAQDRASGSGVFARDPDAIVDFTELELTDDIKNNVRDSEYDTAWQVEFVTREFAQPKSTKIWFKYPLHELDVNGDLAGCWPRGDSRNNLKQSQDGKTKTHAEKDGILLGAFNAQALGRAAVPVMEIVEYLMEDGENKKTVERKVYRWIAGSQKFTTENGKMKPI